MKTKTTSTTKTPSKNVAAAQMLQLSQPNCKD